MKLTLIIELTRESGRNVGPYELAEAVSDALGGTLYAQHPDSDEETEYVVVDVNPVVSQKAPFPGRGNSVPHETA